jgi:hypothetical protein
MFPRIYLGRVGEEGTVESDFRDFGGVAVRRGGEPRDFVLVVPFGGVDAGGEGLVASLGRFLAVPEEKSVSFDRSKFEKSEGTYEGR